MNQHERSIYLTFDDGPIPQSTPFILETLAHYNVRATFFMVGQNVEKHPELYQQIVEAGHCVGNHTYNHISGFKHSIHRYTDNTNRADKLIHSNLFRPPHGWMRWSQYAQSLTNKVMKGMLTGPVTILQWSFVRNDIPRSTVCKQIAVALSDELLDLEKAGIKVIQIDEPAIREGLPLKRADWDAYLQWAGEAFRLSSMGCKDDTQIHTHMCYSEFNDILPAIAALDADVITIETSRSDMELLTAFGDFKYPNDIGPGVYDIHSPRVPTAEEIEHLLRKALQVVPKERLWVNPDCGLKTRGWPETIAALKVMVDVTKKLRAELA